MKLAVIALSWQSWLSALAVTATRAVTQVVAAVATRERWLCTIMIVLTTMMVSAVVSAAVSLTGTGSANVCSGDRRCNLHLLNALLHVTAALLATASLEATAAAAASATGI